jgi:glycosyltransferase involved in cell wall biosynthesis
MNRSVSNPICSPPQLSIVIPALNEKENLDLLLPALNEVLVGMGVTAEIVVIDGGSGDGTREAAEKRGARVTLQTEPGVRFRAAALILCVIFLVSPYTQEHHLVVLLLPLMLLLLNAPHVPWPAREMAVLIGSVLLLGSRYSLEQFPAFHHGALSLFATGKLLGVIGLAWVLISRLRAERTPA